MKTVLANMDVFKRAAIIGEVIRSRKPGGTLSIYAVPKGGIPAMYAIAANTSNVNLVCVSDPEDANIIVDDIIDSGATREKYFAINPQADFHALVNKTTQEDKDLGWVVFPWEGTSEGSIETSIQRLLQFVDPNPERGGLVETPARVAKAWEFWTSGYEQDPKDILKVFEDGAENYDQMITVKDIPLYSHCEHHLAAIIGTATISYIPTNKIVGLSKLSRLVNMYARRLQVQERLTSQIADALMDNLNPLGVGVYVKARHLCMESRGVCQQGHHTITTALRGEIYTDSSTKAEFLSTCKD